MYTYAFCKTPTDPIELPPGLMGPLHLISVNQVAALVEADVDWETLQRDDRRLIDAAVVHDGVIRSLFAQTPVLPLRFGTRFASEANLLTHLQTHQVDYWSKLTQLADKAEFTLKFLPVDLEADDAIPDEAQGRSYFLAKKQRYQAQASRKQQQLDELQRLQGAIAQRHPTAIFSETRSGEPQAYLLVAAQPDDLVQQVLDWQQQHTLWQLSLSDPLPPYHFV